jgi:hypothetical protein
MENPGGDHHPVATEELIMREVRGSIVVACSCLALSIAATDARAQLNTQHIKGTVGLKAGSQPPPDIYLIAPLIYVYNTSEVKTSDGTRLPGTASLTSAAYAGGFSVVTTKKMLGGFYGFQMLFPAAVNNRIQGTEIDSNPGPGLTDSAIVPISLGWHFKRADAIAGYTIYLPTGQFHSGASDNTGFGMWGHEPSVGTTVYLTASRQYHASTVANVTFNTKKRGTDTKVGTTMNLEGGVGGDFLKGGLTAGLVYYTELKLTDDRIAGLPGILIHGKNKVFALGPEVSMPLAWNHALHGFLKVNYQWETYARTTTQGSEVTVLTTFFLKPIKLP